MARTPDQQAAYERMMGDAQTVADQQARRNEGVEPDTDPAGPWVDIVFVDGDDYDAAVDAANDAGGSIDAVAEYLSQWDYGTETDDAHTRDTAPWGAADTLHPVTVDGLDYVLTVNHRIGYYSLNRRPLS